MSSVWKECSTRVQILSSLWREVVSLRTRTPSAKARLAIGEDHIKLELTLSFARNELLEPAFCFIEWQQSGWVFKGVGGDAEERS